MIKNYKSRLLIPLVYNTIFCIVQTICGKYIFAILHLLILLFFKLLLSYIEKKYEKYNAEKLMDKLSNF